MAFAPSELAGGEKGLPSRERLAKRRAFALKALALYRSARASQDSLGLAMTRSRLIPAYIHLGELDTAAMELKALNAQHRRTPFPLSSKSGIMRSE